jgi:hypothetical protein
MHSAATCLVSTTIASICLPAAVDIACEYFFCIGLHKSTSFPCTPSCNSRSSSNSSNNNNSNNINSNNSSSNNENAINNNLTKITSINIINNEFNKYY